MEIINYLKQRFTKLLKQNIYFAQLCILYKLQQKAFSIFFMNKIVLKGNNDRLCYDTWIKQYKIIR